MFLLDTNVIAETRKRRPSASLVAWLSALSSTEIHISAWTIGEIATGVERMRRKEPDIAREIDNWLDALGATANVLPLTEPILRAVAKLGDTRTQPSFSDATLAATALHHGLTIATRTPKAFEPFGVLVTNPFTARR